VTKRVGIVGAGAIGRKRAQACHAIGFKVIWVDDLDRSMVNKFCSDFGCIGIAPNEEPPTEVDLVIICTPHYVLCEKAKIFVERGITTLIEKPAGISLNEIKNLLSTARKSGTQVFVGYNYRFHPSVEQLKHYIDERVYGRLLKVRARHGHGARTGYEQEWRCQKELSGGGELVDQGSHLIDLCKYLFGSLEYVYSDLATKFWQSPVEDDVFLHLKTGSDVNVYLFASWFEWRNIFSFEVFFEKAKFEISGFNGSYGLETLTCYFQEENDGPPEILVYQYPKPDRSWEDELLSIFDPHDMKNSKLEDSVDCWRLINQVYNRQGR
jgi:predicted dehydrogenase